MKVYRSLEDLKEYKDSVVTVGNFDGIHRGHLKIIERLVHKTRRCNCRSVLITFSPHPQTLKPKKGQFFSLLTPLDEKIDILKNTGIDILLVLPFNNELFQMKADSFIIKIVKEKVGAQYIIIGFNHSFGSQRSGDVNLLQQLSEDFDFTIELVKPCKVGKIVISSTKIRDLLKKGDVSLANKMLGRYYTLEGKVVKGHNIGQKLGFPTANIAIENKYKLVPKDGVYAVLVSNNEQRRKGTAYIGKRPTFQGKKRMVEIYLHDYFGDLYGSNLKVEFLNYIREEKKFNSINELGKNIKNDINETRKIFF